MLSETIIIAHIMVAVINWINKQESKLHFKRNSITLIQILGSLPFDYLKVFFLSSF